MPYRLCELGLDGRTLLCMRLFLRFEGVLHILDILVQAARDGLHRLGRLFLECLFAGLENLLVLQRQGRLGRLDGLLLCGLDGDEGPFVLLFFANPERLFRLDL